MQLLPTPHSEFLPKYLPEWKRRNCYRLQFLESIKSFNKIWNTQFNQSYVLTMKLIHIFKRFESSTSPRMTGFTTLMISQIGALHFTEPEGRIITFVPITSDVSTRARFADGWSSLSITGIGSGTEMFKVWCTSLKFLSENSFVARSSFSSTILAGNPTTMRSSAFFISASLYSCT